MANRKFNNSSTKDMNVLITNFRQLAKSPRRNLMYDSGFLLYCIDRISHEFGQSRRYIMCKLLENGLAENPQYAPLLPGWKKDFESDMSKV